MTPAGADRSRAKVMVFAGDMRISGMLLLERCTNRKKHTRNHHSVIRVPPLVVCVVWPRGSSCFPCFPVWMDLLWEVELHNCTFMKRSLSNLSSL
jgi:hypothetical protein